MAKHGAKAGGGIWSVIFWLALVVFIGAACVLGFIFYSYWSADKGYEKIADQALIEGTTLADMTVDWDYLRSINSDIVGWVYLPGTEINYPIVQTDNNDTYLTMDFNQNDGFSARCGTIFMDYNNDSEMSDENSVLYGHHMNDGSMFADISKKLVDQDAFNECRTVYILTPHMNYQCQTFALVLTDGWDALVETNFPSEAEKAEYVQDKIDRSVVVPNEGFPEASHVEKLFTFSTCDYTKDNGRAVLFSQVMATAVPGSASYGALVDEQDLIAMQEAGEAA